MRTGASRRSGSREGRPRPVVVRDDDVEPELAGAGDLLDRRDAAVDGDHEVDAIRREQLDRLDGEAVALLEAARQAPFDVCADLPQGQHGQGRRRDPVHVIVAVDADPLVRLRPPHGCDRPPRSCRPAPTDRARAARLRGTRAPQPARGVRAGRGRSQSSRSHRVRRRVSRRDSNHTVEWSSGPPASPRRRYGPSRTASYATAEAGRLPDEAVTATKLPPSGMYPAEGGNQAAGFRSCGIPLRAASAARRSRRSCTITFTHSITTAADAPITQTPIGAKKAICSIEYLVTAAPTSQMTSTAATIATTRR